MNALLLSVLLAAPAADTSDKSDVASGLQSEGVEKAKYNEIERGFGVRLNVGVLSFLTPAGPTIVDGTVKRYGPGMMVGMELAYDIAQIFDVGAFFYFGQTPGHETAPCAPPLNACTGRDLSTLFGGLIARFSFFHTERLFLGIKAGGGFGMMDNRIEARTLGIAVPAALTAEYFTRIRHFSLALDVGALIWIPMGGGAFAVGLQVLPAIKYTF